MTTIGFLQDGKFTEEESLKNAEVLKVNHFTDVAWTLIGDN